MKLSLTKNMLLALGLAIVCLATYSNSLNNDFLIDDHGLILTDTKLRNSQFLFYHFVPDMNQYLQIGDSHRAAYYRPVPHVLIALNYLMFQDNPVGINSTIRRRYENTYSAPENIDVIILYLRLRR